MRSIVFGVITLWIACLLSSLVAYADKNVPSWYGAESKCDGCVLRFGTSQGALSENGAYQEARIETYKSLAAEVFGIGIRSTSTQSVENHGTQYSEDSVGYLEVSSLPSETIKKEILRASNTKFDGFVCIKFLNSDIEKERKRQREYGDIAFSKKLKSIEHSARIGKTSELTGSLAIKGAPEKSEVYLDKDLIAHGDAYFPSVAVGSYSLRVMHPDYHPLRAKLEIEPGKKAFVEVDLQPNQGELVIDSVPSGAVLEINGSIRGRTPMVLKLRTGTYSVVIEKDGHIKRTFNVDIETDRRSKYQVTLKKE